MACGCSGQSTIGLTSGEMQASPTPMPHYQVTGTDGAVQTFTLYVEAMLYRSAHGGVVSEVR